MDIEEEKKWYREMLIESAREDGLEQGLEQGIQEKALDIASNMLKEKMDINFISKLTGLSKEHIKNISKTMNY